MSKIWLGLIVVLRTGRRAFQVRDKETQRMVFDRALEPFDLLIMPAHGSNRTSVRREVQEALRQKIEKAQRDAERRCR